jgi:hypothetical protein
LTRPASVQVNGSDLLPTREAVALAKGLAARACAAKAAEAAWPSLVQAVRWIDRTHMVALAVLIELCPEVSPERLAICLGVEPPVLTALVSWRTRETYAAELIEAVVQDVMGEG